LPNLERIISRSTLKDLYYRLRRQDGKPYGQYRTIRGEWWSEKSCLRVLHVQGDPFAPASRVEWQVPLEDLGLDPKDWRNEISRLALADFMHRRAHALILEWNDGEQEDVRVVRPSAAMIRRTACYVDDNGLILRLGVQLPGADRRIEAEKAIQILTGQLPELLAGLQVKMTQPGALDLHHQTLRRYVALQKFLGEKNLVAFVANGAILPRASGTSEDPMVDALPFMSPPELQVEFEFEGELLKGMGVPRGITVITGGAFHGKSTLLQALQEGVYPHIPGDGREIVVTEASAFKLRAEDGRQVCGTDLSAFLNQLPGNYDSAFFVTANASGSTSQAANLVEAWETGTRTFLVDEDRSAVNFLFKDERMRALVPDSMDPIRHLSGCLQDLRAAGMSMLLCQGASGDFLAEADRILRLHHFEVQDITTERDALWGSPEINQAGRDGKGFAPQCMELRTWGEVAGHQVKHKTKGRTLVLGKTEIPAQGLEQFACEEQLRAIGEILVPWMESGHPTKPQNPEWDPKKIWKRLVQSNGADLAMPRRQEMWAVLRRIPGLQYGPRSED
jgi:predicted ABC-class ATPase